MTNHVGQKIISLLQYCRVITNECRAILLLRDRGDSRHSLSELRQSYSDLIRHLSTFVSRDRSLVHSFRISQKRSCFLLLQNYLDSFEKSEQVAKKIQQHVHSTRLVYQEGRKLWKRIVASVLVSILCGMLTVSFSRSVSVMGTSWVLGGMYSFLLQDAELQKLRHYVEVVTYHATNVAKARSDLLRIK